jgi:hypothetical protein
MYFDNDSGSPIYIDDVNFRVYEVYAPKSNDSGKFTRYGINSPAYVKRRAPPSLPKDLQITAPRHFAAVGIFDSLTHAIVSSATGRYDDETIGAVVKKLQMVMTSVGEATSLDKFASKFFLVNPIDPTGKQLLELTSEEISEYSKIVVSSVGDKVVLLQLLSKNRFPIRLLGPSYTPKEPKSISASTLPVFGFVYRPWNDAITSPFVIKCLSKFLGQSEPNAAAWIKQQLADGLGDDDRRKRELGGNVRVARFLSSDKYRFTKLDPDSPDYKEVVENSYVLHYKTKDQTMELLPARGLKSVIVRVDDGSSFTDYQLSVWVEVRRELVWCVYLILDWATNDLKKITDLVRMLRVQFEINGNVDEADSVMAMMKKTLPDVFDANIPWDKALLIYGPPQIQIVLKDDYMTVQQTGFLKTLNAWLESHYAGDWGYQTYSGSYVINLFTSATVDDDPEQFVAKLATDMPDWARGLVKVVFDPKTDLEQEAVFKPKPTAEDLERERLAEEEKQLVAQEIQFIVGKKREVEALYAKMDMSTITIQWAENGKDAKEKPIDAYARAADIGSKFQQMPSLNKGKFGIALTGPFPYPKTWNPYSDHTWLPMVPLTQKITSAGAPPSYFSLDFPLACCRVVTIGGTFPELNVPFVGVSGMFPGDYLDLMLLLRKDMSPIYQDRLLRAYESCPYPMDGYWFKPTYIALWKVLSYGELTDNPVWSINKLSFDGSQLENVLVGSRQLPSLPYTMRLLEVLSDEGAKIYKHLLAGIARLAKGFGLSRHPLTGEDLAEYGGAIPLPPREWDHELLVELLPMDYKVRRLVSLFFDKSNESKEEFCKAFGTMGLEKAFDPLLAVKLVNDIVAEMEECADRSIPEVLSIAPKFVDDFKRVARLVHLMYWFDSVPIRTKEVPEFAKFWRFLGGCLDPWISYDAAQGSTDDPTFITRVVDRFEKLYIQPQVPLDSSLTEAVLNKQLTELKDLEVALDPNPDNPKGAGSLSNLSAAQVADRLKIFGFQ